MVGGDAVEDRLGPDRPDSSRVWCFDSNTVSLTRCRRRRLEGGGFRDDFRAKGRPIGRRVSHYVGVLLSQDEVGPVELEGRDGSSPFFLVCDHAGRLIPRALESLGLSEEQLDRHIAWDIGAAGVARRLAEALGAPAILQRYSRLVIDCNRPLDSAESIARRSERTDVPGNADVGPSESEERARAIFWPYHDEIRARLDRRAAGGRPTVLVAMHSFTPVFLDRARQWHAGVLYNRDARLGGQLLRALRDEGDLVVGDNEPYAAGDLTDYTIVHHGERRGLLHVEVEIRQDLIADARGQDAWAARLARLLPLALVACEGVEGSPAPRPSPEE
jgi:predicted N-formylglutamate amidohydrolase